MRFIKLTFFALALILLLTPAAGQALTQNQLNIYNSGINFFDSDVQDCTTVSGETGSGPLMGLTFPDVSDPNALASSIDKYVADTQPSSPFVGMGSLFVAAGQKYNVNPAMIIGFALKESSLGINQPAGSYDAFGLTAQGDVSGYPFQNGIYYFPSWQASIEPEFNYVYGGFIAPGSTYHSGSVYELMTHYTPSNPEEQTQVTLSVMHKILDGLSETGGSASGSSPTFDPGAVSTTQCQSTANYQAGANGFNLSGQNAMVSFHQCDSAWGNQPYGSGGTICDTGCGITSLSMVIDTLKGLNKTPADYAKQYGAYNQGGTVWSLWPKAAQDYGLNEQDLGSGLDKAAAIIRQGGLVIIPVNSGGGGYFTHDSHLMVLRAVDDQGNFYLADPGTNDQGINGYGHDTENTAHSQQFLISHGFMGSLFAFTK